MTDFEMAELRLDLDLLREELAHERERAELAEAEAERLRTALRNQGASGTGSEGSPPGGSPPA